MLVALNEREELFILTESITKATLQQLRNESFYCPQCKEQLLLKAGAVKVPHFAHKANSHCINYFSEGETYPHLLGKSQLFHHFSKLYHAELEPYLPALKQRPDLLVQSKKVYALEFQCSRFEQEVYNRRTNGYIQHELEPVWLLKTPSTLFRNGQVLKTTLNVFQQQFIQRDVLITYDPLQQDFVYFSGLLFLHGHTFLTIPRTLPLVAQKLPLLQLKPLSIQAFSSLLEIYNQHRQKFLHARLFYSRKGVKDLFLSAIYHMRLNRERLPMYIGVPVRHAIGLPVFSVEWQLLLFYFMQQFQLTLQLMNRSAISYFLEWSHLPTTTTAYLAVENYVFILKQLAIEQLNTPCDSVQLLRILHGEFIAIPHKD